MNSKPIAGKRKNLFNMAIALLFLYFGILEKSIAKTLCLCLSRCAVSPLSQYTSYTRPSFQEPFQNITVWKGFAKDFTLFAAGHYLGEYRFRENSRNRNLAWAF